ncbi:(2Fe-2S)-binding protein [Desulfosporosinus sp. PR]|uniref:(2Fe-2S)-binding protein n=1 Tax=Candidatus Desulfosporosinus nitrosoreducens TaxID=3401928 RepID=UPI0027ECE9CE|nr:(2Fe-2S)-binding protein [Desulfosporosinus sp. PR]MDQ7095127.1 (2Fe-2S)-binding protein [Desulfosporosinus sp. PR]
MTRLLDHPILGKLPERKAISFQFDGKKYQAYENETIAAALLANGVRTLRVHEVSGKPRGIYCNIGHCLECRVTVNGQPNIRACLTVVKRGMVVESGKQLPNAIKRMEDDNE